MAWQWSPWSQTAEAVWCSWRLQCSWRRSTPIPTQLRHYLSILPPTWSLNSSILETVLLSSDRDGTDYLVLATLLAFLVPLPFFLKFSKWRHLYIFCELELWNLEELIESKSKADLTLMQGVFSLGDVLCDLFLRFEDGVGERLDCVEKLHREGSTWSSSWRVQLSMCSRRDRKLIKI